jgi:hypothetical protein
LGSEEFVSGFSFSPISKTILCHALQLTLLALYFSLETRMVREFHGGGEMAKKSKRSKKTTKSSNRSKVTVKLVKKAKAASKSVPSLTPVVRSSSVRAHIVEGTRLFALAGRPTKEQFIQVYGPKGPKMTWAQRAKAGVDAKHFQEALKVKS